jgi:hypothetical protein
MYYMYNLPTYPMEQGFDAASNMHTIVYEDGHQEVINLLAPDRQWEPDQELDSPSQPIEALQAGMPGVQVTFGMERSTASRL